MILYKKGGKAKKKNWIKGANASIKRRGTKGKCGPNCDRPGCTGRALALCHAFHTIARRRKKKKKSRKKGEGGGLSTENRNTLAKAVNWKSY